MGELEDTDGNQKLALASSFATQQRGFSIPPDTSILDTSRRRSSEQEVTDLQKPKPSQVGLQAQVRFRQVNQSGCGGREDATPVLSLERSLRSLTLSNAEHEFKEGRTSANLTQPTVLLQIIIHFF